jgi:hypothetical protein
VWAWHFSHLMFDFKWLCFYRLFNTHTCMYCRIWECQKNPLPNQLNQTHQCNTSLKGVFIMNKIIRCGFYCNKIEHFQEHKSNEIHLTLLAIIIKWDLLDPWEGVFYTIYFVPFRAVI